MELRRVDEVMWEIPAHGDMRVPARVFADEELLDAIRDDRSLEQLCNVAALPGIVEASLAMPDIHQGYGFPVGGIAATAPPDGVVSPGGVGYDINCGVRLLALPLTAAELGQRKEALVHELSRQVPAGTGRGGELSLRDDQLDLVLAEGPRALVERHGIGTAEDVELTESRGRLEGADPDEVSERSGSRGLGHQVCTDFVKRMDAALGRHGIRLPDRQLSCAPVNSDDGRSYLGAMAAAANFAWANRHAIAHAVREAVAAVLGRDAAAGTRQVYDVAHNVAKLEEHSGRTVCVHRKGATRAFPAGSPDLPEAQREVGQPVFIPGSMGTASFVLAGEPGSMERSFGTVCHGAGRQLSRTAARKRVQGADLRRELEARGITVRCASNRGLAEEAPFAYKDVDNVVRVVERAGLARRVARLRPIGGGKG